MILCPICHKKEYVGVLFCSECGTQLVSTEQDKIDEVMSEPGIMEQEISVDTSTLSDPWMENDSLFSLVILETGDIIQIANREETTLGRISEGQPIIPDIDLSAYSAYETGVSRLHASLKVKDDQIIIIDLASANGTRVNGKKIPPNIPEPVNNGDVLTLGKLKIQVQMRNSI
jgi:pSer/pThr/pTyr-binding forkhead associated (FHA) protein